VSRSSTYRSKLRELQPGAWDAYLLAESGLPGPRANLELLQTVADEGAEAQFRRWLAMRPGEAGPADEFLAACGAVGLGRLAAEGRRDLLAELRVHASDPRWRVREGVAMGLQRLGAVDMPALLEETRRWVADSTIVPAATAGLVDTAARAAAAGPWPTGGTGGTGTGGDRWLERRAVVAALCEPALLKQAPHAEAVLEQLDTLTRQVAEAHAAARRDPSFRVLRQALGYGWSVAIAALPNTGKVRFERWVASDDPDVGWIVRENLKKARLRRLYDA
jgi:hypothetical protein